MSRVALAVEPAPSGREVRPPSAVPAVVAAGAGLVAVLVLALVLGGGRPTPAAPGLAQAGPLVTWGLPVATLAGRIAAVGTVGTLLFAAVLLPGPGRTLPPASRRALRTASWCALAWAASTVGGALLTLSQLVGAAPTASSLRTFVTDLPAGRAAAVVLAAACVVALLVRRCTGAIGAGLLLAVAVPGLVVPAVLTGHSATAADHVLAVVNLSLHVVAATAWVGGLLALLLHGRSREDLAPAAHRFSTVALVCSLVTGLSGLLAAWLVLGRAASASTLSGSGYGWLLLGKTTALLALGVLGWRHRRTSLPRLRTGQPGVFRRFAAVEAAVMLATVALAVALAASPPPAAGSPAASTPAAAQGAQPTSPQPAPPTLEDMSGHDHGDLSVTVLVDETRFHVSAPVAPGARVTVHNSTTTEVTITADNGSFDVVVPGRSLLTFAAPAQPGTYPFSSRHSESFGDVLVVR